MNFDFSVRRALGGDNITRVTSDTIRSGRYGRYSKEVKAVIDSLGNASAEAQQLGSVITTASKLQSSDHVVYIASNSKSALGFIKVGHKKLFIHSYNGTIVEMVPLCVLDFFVHENCQRQGIGLTLFEYMLKDQATKPLQLAYDRPSPKLIAFLKKHYCLESYVPQSNNFIVFNNHPKLANGVVGLVETSETDILKKHAMLNHAKKSYFDISSDALEVGRNGTSKSRTSIQNSSQKGVLTPTYDKRQGDNLRPNISRFESGKTNYADINLSSTVPENEINSPAMTSFSTPSNIATPNSNLRNSRLHASANRSNCSDSVASLLSPGI